MNQRQRQKAEEELNARTDNIASDIMRHYEERFIFCTYRGKYPNPDEPRPKTWTKENWREYISINKLEKALDLRKAALEATLEKQDAIMRRLLQTAKALLAKQKRELRLRIILSETTDDLKAAFDDIPKVQDLIRQAQLKG